MDEQINQYGEDFFILKTFGSLYDVPIDSRSVGKLIKIVGLSDLGTTRPTIYAIENDYIRSYNAAPRGKNYINYKWNFKKCAKEIDDYMKDHNYFNLFYQLKDSELRKKLIGIMYEEYVQMKHKQQHSNKEDSP